MRNLVYVPNRQVGVAKSLEFDDPSYRSPKFFEGPEGQVKTVVVLDICQNHAEIAAAYEAAGIEVETINVAAALCTARQAPGLKLTPKPAAEPKLPPKRDRKALLKAARGLGFKGGRMKTEALRAKVRELEEKIDGGGGGDGDDDD